MLTLIFLFQKCQTSENNQIFASKYKLYLPTEEEFKKELNLDNYVKKDENKNEEY